LCSYLAITATLAVASRLIDRGGKRVLRLDVVETNGLRYGTDLTR
jgi:hypothetical protein